MNPSNESPLVSVIIPTFNCGAKLGATIKSALDQPAGLAEILVEDGGSTDNTTRVLVTFGTAVSWHSHKDRGVYDAMNRGTARASGKFIYFLGAGDRLRPGVLGELKEILESSSGESIVYGNVVLNQTNCVYGREWSASLFRRHSNICHQSMFYGSEAMKTVGEFSLRYPVLADLEYNLRCYAHPAVDMRYINVLIADYEGGGLSETDWDPQFERDFPELVRRYLGQKQFALYKVMQAVPTGLKKAAKKLTVRAARPAR